MIQRQSILFLVRLYHPHVGGVEKHVAEISSLLLKKGLSVTIITERYDKKLPLYEKINGVTLHRIPIKSHGFLKKFFIWKWFLFNRDVLDKADIIHVHDVFYWLLPFKVVTPFKKVFITFHGYEGYPVRLVWKIQRKLAEKLTSGSICVGAFMKKWYLANPTSVIYGGVRVESKNKIPNQQSAVFFGRLDDQTGISEYVKAYRKIKKKYPEFTLTVVGEGELGHIIPQGVTVKKFDKDVDRYILANRFVFVSRYLSMLEALVLKREIIAVYDNPVKRDYLLMSPFRKYILIAKDSREIEEYVVSALEKGISAERVKKGYEWAKRQTWEEIASVYLRLWSEVI